MVELKAGMKVRIKSAEEINRMYPQGMPYDLCEDMLKMCGGAYIIDSVTLINPRSGKDFRYCVDINDWMWPSSVIESCLTPKGNSIV